MGLCVVKKERERKPATHTRTHMYRDSFEWRDFLFFFRSRRKKRSLIACLMIRMGINVYLRVRVRVCICMCICVCVCVCVCVDPFSSKKRWGQIKDANLAVGKRKSREMNKWLSINDE